MRYLTNSGHALMSPSAAERWINCPGSVMANASAARTDNKYSIEGTSAHTLLELCLRTQLNPDLFLGSLIKAGENEIDQDMIEGVKHALIYVAEYERDNPGCVVTIEDRVYPQELMGTEFEGLGEDGPIHGTPDIQIRNKQIELVTIDYKHGSGSPVAVKDNAQIKLYHLGGRVRWGKFGRYRSVVVQPRLPRRKPVQEHTITDAQLMAWVKTKVIPVIPVALADDAPRAVGGWCFYCADKRLCPAQSDSQDNKASEEFKSAPRYTKQVILII